jgi:hypothetical protein
MDICALALAQRASVPNFIKDVNTAFFAYFREVSRSSTENPKLAALRRLCECFAPSPAMGATEDALKDCILRRCALMSWLLHHASRMMQNEELTQKALAVELPILLHNFYALVECALTEGGTIMLHFVLAALANVVPWRFDGEPTAALSIKGGGGGLHWILAACDDAALYRVTLNIKPQAAKYFALAYFSLGRRLAAHLLAEVPVPGAACADFLRALALHHDARAFAVGGASALEDGAPAPPPALPRALPPRLQDLLAPALHSGAALHATVLDFKGAEVWSPLVPAQLHQRLATELLLAGRGGEAFEVLRAGAFSESHATTAISCCVSLAVALTPRLLLASPGRVGTDWWKRHLEPPLGAPVSLRPGSALGEQLLPLLYLEPVNAYARALGLADRPSGALIAEAEERRAAALYGGKGGAADREVLSRGFLQRAAREFGSFARGIPLLPPPGVDRRASRLECHLMDAAGFLLHFCPTLPLALADALDALGEHKDALRVIERTPGVLDQLLSREGKVDDPVQRWPLWGLHRSPKYARENKTSPFFPLDYPPPPGMPPLDAERRAAALRLANARLMTLPIRMRKEGSLNSSTRAFFAHLETLLPALDHAGEFVRQMNAEEGEGDEIAAHKLLSHFFLVVAFDEYTEEPPSCDVYAIFRCLQEERKKRGRRFLQELICEAGLQLPTALDDQEVHVQGLVNFMNSTSAYLGSLRTYTERKR